MALEIVRDAHEVRGLFLTMAEAVSMASLRRLQLFQSWLAMSA
jgi:hypothetical protein